MLTTLDHLEQHIKKSQKKNSFTSFTKEIKGFLIFFVIVFIVNSVVVNAQLYQEALIDMVSQLTGSSSTITTQTLGNYFNNNTKNNLQNAIITKKQHDLDTMIANSQNISNNQDHDFVAKDLTSNNLQTNLNSYNLDFNLLPPTDRVIIPSLNLDTPLLQSSFNKHIDTITKEDFDKDLYK